MTKTILIGMLSCAVWAGLTMPARGQANDALLNKLVSKGILSQQEADDLKKDADAGFDKAYRTKMGLPDWVTQLRISGDVRGRYEFFKTDNSFAGAAEPNKDRHRWRYRLRAGVTATLKENFELGFRLISDEPTSDGSGGDPISANTTFQNNGSKKFVYLDTVYGKWTPINNGTWMLGVTIGKMDNPFVLSDMLFDTDYTPEGGAIQAGYKINDSHALKLTGAFFALDEINQGAQASDDPYFYGVQLRHEGKWAKQLSTSVGVAWMTLVNEENLDSASVPNINGGNTRYAVSAGNNIAGDLVHQYSPIIMDASATFTLDKFPLYPGSFPIKVGGEFMHNPGAPRNNCGYWGGISLGKAARKYSWEISYRYKVLEEDAWYEEFVDSDFAAYRQIAFVGDSVRGYRAGTGVEGHITKVVFALSDSMTLGSTWYYADSIHPGRLANGRQTESGQHRVQLDAVWKF